MSLTTRGLLDAVQKYADRLTGSDHDKAAFQRNVDLLAARLTTMTAAARAALGGEPAVDPAWFTGGGDEPYIIGGSPGNPNGVSFSSTQAIAWFTFVIANRLGYHHVRPTLLPGSHVLTPEGLAYVKAFEALPDLEEAPEDFNPLGLEVIP